MSLNIKKETTHRLAQHLAGLTGESLTDAVTKAITERLNRLHAAQGPSLADRLVAIGEDCAAHIKEPFLTIDHGDLLYDDKGLPR